MLLALLICTDGDCAVHHEAYGAPTELEGLSCELCGCALQAIAWSEAAPNGTARTDVHTGVQVPVQIQILDPV